jgi:lipooligosaccharide transport system permease protein
VLEIYIPQVRVQSLAVWRRNALVWRKLLVPSLLLNFGEPFLYLLGLGYGLGRFIGDMQGLSYLTFLASGIVASSAMNTASFEGLYSVFTRMVPQQTHRSMLCAPVDVDDIVLGELLWCASKSVISSTVILIVATLLGAVQTATAVLVIPVIFLVGLAFAGMAIAVTMFSNSYDFFNYYTTLVITPMFILCGVFYPVDTLPAPLYAFAQLLPLTHAIALVRPLVAGLPLGQPLLHAGVLLLYALVGFYAAVIMARRRLIP